MSDYRRSSLLYDTEKTHLAPQDLFDKIINLKLYTAKGDSYVIRSDYEVVYKNLEIQNAFKEGSFPITTYSIRKCQFKPSIKIHYQPISGNLGIKADIYISNFFIFTKDGKALMNFNATDNPLETVVVNMGYFGQFENMPHGTFAELQELYEDYGVQPLIFNVEYVSTESFPPDSVLHIHAYVGSALNTPLTKPTNMVTYKSISNSSSYIDVNYVEEKATEDSKAFIYKPASSTSTNYIDKLLYQLITRRFTRYGSKVERDKEGKMSDTDAEKYGIKIYCSYKARALAILNGLKKDLENKPIEYKSYFCLKKNATQTFNAFNYFVTGETLVKKELITGDWLVYTASESKEASKLAASFKYVVEQKIAKEQRISAELLGHIQRIAEEDSMQKKKAAGLDFSYEKKKLPAIYNITFDTRAQIVAPFFFFVNPFEEIEFQARYPLNSRINYYTASETKKYSKFIVLQQHIAFATVEDINEMTLVCVNQDDQKTGGK